MAVLSCIALCAACDGGSQQADPTGNTEVELLISDPALEPDEIAFWIDFVSYRITCPASGLPPYDDSVDADGRFEIKEGADPPVWELVTDLPPTLCRVSLWVFYEDEIVCSGYQELLITEDGDPSTTNKFDIALECSLSVRGPIGDAEVDGSFEFIHGNYCPKLVWLGAVPPVVEAAVPPVTSIEVSSFDPDSTCGMNCDPQTCDETQNPPVCTAAQDPGFTTTLFAPAGHGSFVTASATGTPLPNGAGTPIELQTTFECDPLFPGPTEICAAARDGDKECAQVRCITVFCPDLCAGDPCRDGRECTRDRCNPLDGSCSNDPAPPGIACNNCQNTCQSNGACTGPAWTALDEFTGVTTFTGTVQPYSATLVNPYSGASFSANGMYRLNESSYLGLGAVGEVDTLLGTPEGDVLLVQDPPGTQRICGVEEILALNSPDVIFLPDDFIMLGDTWIVGGNGNDILMGNVGNDTIEANAGDDVCDGGPGDDTIDGGPGDDTFRVSPGRGVPDIGFDSISGGMASNDRLEIDAEQNQILIELAASPYELKFSYLDTPIAQIREVELLVLNDAIIDLTTCTGPDSDVCNLCGNDDLNGGEGCDDGNNVDGDGCAADCTAEY
jgi:cysteine-rich repeat protein